MKYPASVRNRQILPMMLAAVLTVGACNKAKGPKILWQIPEFTLVDHNGTAITREIFTNQTTIVNFIFTRCAAVCPTITQKMRELQTLTDAWDRKPLLLSFTVDPEYDTPARLRAYAAEFDAGRRWRFVTGDAQTLERLLTQSIRVSMARDGLQPQNGAPNIIHNEHFMLVDRKARVRGFFASGEPQRVVDLLRDTRVVMREKRK